jgi:hypothetical protein
MGLGSYSYILNSIIFAAMVLKRSHTFSHFFFFFLVEKKSILVILNVCLILRSIESNFDSLKVTSFEFNNRKDSLKVTSFEFNNRKGSFLINFEMHFIY